MKLERPLSATRSCLVAVYDDVPTNANGVLYALGGFSGGLDLVHQGWRTVVLNTTCSRFMRTKIQSHRTN